MPSLSNISAVVEFTRNNATTFTGIGSVIPGETRLLGSRAAIGHGEINGICIVTAAAPGAVAGTLTIEQSVDAMAWDQVDAFPMTIATGVLPFSIEIVGRYIRAQFAVPIGEVYSIRFGAHLNPWGSF